MRLTTKGRFAVAAILDLASQPEGAPVPLMSISERQNISLSYLEQLFAKLRRHHLVQSFRGPGGGYRLARPKSAISIAEVIEAVDEPVDATGCQGRGDCHDRWPCISHRLWSGLNQVMDDYLRTISIQDLVSERVAGEEHRIDGGSVSGRPTHGLAGATDTPVTASASKAALSMAADMGASATNGRSL